MGKYRKKPVVIEAFKWTGGPGDFIILGVAGEIYPCKPDIFDATYEAVGV